MVNSKEEINILSGISSNIYLLLFFYLIIYLYFLTNFFYLILCLFLSGNIFSCSIINPKLSLPISDSESDVIDSYNCGSNNFNISLAFFGINFILFIFFKSNTWKYRYNLNNKINDNIINYLANYSKNINILAYNGIKYTKKLLFDELNKKEIEISTTSEINYLEKASMNLPKKVKLLSNITTLCELSVKLRKLLINLTLVIIIIIMPISILMNNYFCVYQVSYSFVISFTFLSGVIPSIILFIIMIVSIVKINILFPRLNTDSSFYVEEIEFNKLHYYRKLSLFLVFIINIILMFMINGLFIYGTFHLDSFELFFIEILVAFIKIIWKWYFLPSIIKIIKKYFNKNNTVLVSNDEVLFQCCIGVFNNIFIPLIVVSVLSPKCFYNIFVPYDPVVSSYSIQQCHFFNSFIEECNQYKLNSFTTKYDAPFDYSFQCSSSIVTSYSSIYIYMALFILITGPLSMKFVKLIYSTINQNSYLFKIIDKFIPHRLKSIHHIKENNENMNSKKKSKKKIYFNQSNFIVNIISYLSIIVTIGLLFQS